MSRSQLVSVAIVLLVVAGILGAWLLLRGSPAGNAFAGEADQLCARYHDEVASVGTPATLGSVPAFVARERPLAQRLATRLDGLEPPASKRADYTRFLALVHRQLENLDTELRAARTGNVKAFRRAVASSRRVHAQQTRLAKRLDFLVCGR